MKLQKFIENFALQFEETDKSKFQANTKYKELEEWTSLMALSTIIMINDEYGVLVEGDNLRNFETIEDLYNIVESK